MGGVARRAIMKPLEREPNVLLLAGDIFQGLRTLIIMVEN
jgi:hypothetical protein